MTRHLATIESTTLNISLRKYSKLVHGSTWRQANTPYTRESGMTEANSSVYGVYNTQPILSDAENVIPILSEIFSLLSLP